ncbi:MAG: LD-carboxypeptidase [Thermaurantimonas sp.]
MTILNYEHVVILPPLLKSGDTIGICAPARYLRLEDALQAIKSLEEYGFKVVMGPNIGRIHHQWSAPDRERAAEIQDFIDHPDIKAIFTARGGYGTVRIIDQIDFSPLKKHPKWFVGFSDITVLLSHVWTQYHLPSLHSPMLINFRENTSESKESIFIQLTTGRGMLRGTSGLPGSTRGRIIGGNLSVLYSLVGSPSFTDIEDKILVLEDVDEYLYHIDRMLYGLSRAGVFNRLAGLVVGSFTKIKDNSIPFGANIKELFLHHFGQGKIPVAFDANIGHHEDQRAFIHGADAELVVDSSGNWHLSWQLT